MGAVGLGRREKRAKTGGMTSPRDCSRQPGGLTGSGGFDRGVGRCHEAIGGDGLSIEWKLVYLIGGENCCHDPSGRM